MKSLKVVFQEQVRIAPLHIINIDAQVTSTLYQLPLESIKTHLIGCIFGMPLKIIFHLYHETRNLVSISKMVFS